MAKVTVLYFSFNPDWYDAKEIAKASYDEVKEFVEKHSPGAVTYKEVEIDLTNPSEYKFFPDCADSGDTSDCLMTWIKVCGD